MFADLVVKWHDLTSRCLNDPQELKYLYVTRKQTVAQIAKTIGCSPQLVQKKLQTFGLTSKDEFFQVYTGRWHSLAKRGLINAAKPHIKKIETTTNEIYPRTTSKNATVFKKILSEMQEADQDTLSSMGGILGMTRKATYMLIGKFAICLYDFDTYYAERMDYIIRRLFESGDLLYIDEQSFPSNWYPNRNNETTGKYLINRTEERVFDKVNGTPIIRTQ